MVLSSCWKLRLMQFFLRSLRRKLLEARLFVLWDLGSLCARESSRGGCKTLGL